MRKVNLIVKVVEINGKCPVYEVGDKFYIREGYKLESQGFICMHSLASIMPYYNALSEGVSPEKLGLGKGNKAYVQCLDPCKYTGGGTVVFEITKEE